MGVKIRMWNADDPERVAEVETGDAQSAGVLLGGAIQAAIDNGGKLAIEAEAS